MYEANLEMKTTNMTTKAPIQKIAHEMNTDSTTSASIVVYNEQETSSDMSVSKPYFLDE